MLKKLLATALMSLSMLSASWAAVDVNTADHAALETLSGIGPKRSKSIIEERTKNGPYKDATDFKARVAGIGAKTLCSAPYALACSGRADACAGGGTAAGMEPSCLQRPWHLTANRLPPRAVGIRCPLDPAQWSLR